MSHPTPETSDVSQSFIYRSFTKKERRNFPMLPAALSRKYATLLERNFEVANLLRDASPFAREDEADKLELCCRSLSGGHPTKVRPTYYCQLPLFCMRCANLQAQYRQEQLQNSLYRFADKVQATNIRVHKLRLTPHPVVKSNNPEDGQRLSVDLIKNFNALFGAHHNDHNSQRFLDRLPHGRLSARELKAKTLGPSIGAFHLGYQRHDNRHVEHVHFHLTIYTETRTSHKQIFDTVTKLWKTAIRKLGDEYTFHPEDVRMPRSGQRDHLKRLIGGNPFSTLFDVDKENYTQVQKDAMKYARYIGRPVKIKWKAETVIKHEKMMRRLKLKGTNLYLSRGKEGVPVQQLPGGFPAEELKHPFLATYQYDGNWSFFARDKIAEDASSAEQK